MSTYWRTHGRGSSSLQRGLPHTLWGIPGADVSLQLHHGPPCLGDRDRVFAKVCREPDPAACMDIDTDGPDVYRHTTGYTSTHNRGVAGPRGTEGCCSDPECTENVRSPSGRDPQNTPVADPHQLGGHRLCPPPTAKNRNPRPRWKKTQSAATPESPQLSLGALSIRSGPAGGRGGELIANSFTTSLIEAGISVSSDPPHAAKMPLTQGGLQVI